jgi:hypothetical protein
VPEMPRERWLLLMLALALKEEPEANWGQLVQLACDYGRSGRARPDEFASLAHQQIGAVLGTLTPGRTDHA